MASDSHLIDPTIWKPMLQAGAKPLAEFKIGRKKLCLVHTQGSWYVISARCPHQGGPLAAGILNDKEEVVCPWHRFAFDPVSGNSESGGYCVPTYPVQELEGNLYVELPQKKWFELW